MIDELQLIKAISTGQTKENCFIVILRIIHFKLTKTCNFIEILTKNTTLVTLGTTNTFSVLTRPRPCGIPARKTEMAH